MMNPDVLVVGGGPGGAAAGYWLARRGLSVVVVEKKEYPREKACGDGLTPRAIKQLVDMGFDFDGHHRIVGLRAYAGDTRLEMPWPEHSIYPNWGAVIRRADLDMQVAALAEKQGAVVLTGTEAVPVVEAGELTAVQLRRKGAEAEILNPKMVVIADGSLSRFGRKLGMERRKDYPFALAVRGYWKSDNSADGYLESQLDIRDREGRAMPGYGWVFPLGDGEINIGAGALSTFKGWKDLNTSRLIEAYVAQLPCRLAPVSGVIGWRWVTRLVPSTRSTAKASTTHTRPPGLPRAMSPTPSPATQAHCGATPLQSMTSTPTTCGWPGRLRWSSDTPPSSVG